MNNYILNLLIATLITIVSAQTPSKCIIVKKPQRVVTFSMQSIQNFEAGSHKLMPNPVINRYNHYNITLHQKFIHTNEVAISIEKIQTFQPKNGVDFFIRANRKGQIIFVIIAMDETAKWSLMNIYYALSQRGDLVVGNFIVSTQSITTDNNQFLFQNNKIIYTIQYTIPQILNKQIKDVQIYTFISGIKTLDNNLTVKIDYSTFKIDIRTLEIDIYISKGKYPLEHLYISYMIIDYASKLQSISLYSRDTIQNYFAGITQIYPIQMLNNNKQIHKRLLNPQSQENFDTMFGLNGIKLQTQQSSDILYSSIMIKNTIQVNYSCIKKVDCLSKKGKMIYNTQNISNIISTCIVCLQNAIFNDTDKKCVCKQDFIQNNGTCILNITCPQNQLYSQVEKQCVCANFYINKTNKCNSIFQICNKSSVYYKDKCYKIKYKDSSLARCKNDTLFINKSCVYIKNCSNSSLHSNETNQCYCPPMKYMVNNECIPCQNDQVWNGTACACKEAHYKIYGKCVKCDVNAAFNGKICECFPTFRGDGYTCILNTDQNNNTKHPLNFNYGLKSSLKQLKSPPF